MTTDSPGRVSLERMAAEGGSVKASSLAAMADRELLERIVQVAGTTRYLTAGLLARRFPVIFEMVAEGSLTLTTIALLRPHLTDDNYRQLLAAARHRSKREVEHQVAYLAPKADVSTFVRRLPARAPVEGALLDAVAGATDATAAAAATAAMPPSAVAAPITPLPAGRYLLRVTLSGTIHARLRRAQALMSHRVLGGEPAIIIDEALSLLVEHLERTKFARLRPLRASGLALASGAFIKAQLADWIPR